MRWLPWLLLAILVVGSYAVEQEHKARQSAELRANAAETNLSAATLALELAKREQTESKTETADLRGQLEKLGSARDAALQTEYQALARVQAVKDKAASLEAEARSKAGALSGAAGYAKKEQALKDEMARRDAQYAADKKALSDRATAAEQKAADLQKSVDDLKAEVAKLEAALKALEGNPFGGGGK
jgi:hypothetical protein